MSPTFLPTSPEETDRLFVAACNAGDVDMLIALYEEGAGLFRLTGAFTTERDAIRSEFEGLRALWPRLIVHDIAVAHHDGGTLATTRMHASLEATAADSTPICREFRTLEVQRRQPDGTWRYILDDPRGSEGG